MKGTVAIIVILLVGFGVLGAYNWVYLSSPHGYTAKESDKSQPALTTQPSGQFDKATLQRLENVTRELQHDIQRIPISPTDDAYLLTLIQKMSDPSQVKRMTAQQRLHIQQEVMRIQESEQSYTLQVIEILKRLDKHSTDLRLLGDAMQSSSLQQPQWVTQFTHQLEHAFTNGVPHIQSTAVTLKADGFRIQHIYDFNAPDTKQLSEKQRQRQYENFVLYDCLNPSIYMMTVAGMKITVSSKAKNWATYETRELTHTQCKKTFEKYKTTPQTFTQVQLADTFQADSSAVRVEQFFNEVERNYKTKSAPVNASLGRRFKQLARDTSNRPAILQALNKPLPLSIPGGLVVENATLFGDGFVKYSVRYIQKPPVSPRLIKNLTNIHEGYMRVMMCKSPDIQQLLNAGIDIYADMNARFLTQPLTGAYISKQPCMRDVNRFR